MKKPVKSIEAHFFISQKTDDEVRKISAAEGRSVSMVYRDLVEKGLVAGGYRSGSQDIAAMVRTAVEEAMKAPVERLAAISAKGAQISAASFFLAAYTGNLAVPDPQKEEYRITAALARKLGVEYLKLSRDKSLDDFIAQGLGRMEEDDI